MRRWDLDDDLLFPRVAVLAYAKNLVALADVRLDVVKVVGRFPSSYWLQGVDGHGGTVDLYAPFVVDGRFRMYVPFVLQRTLGARGEPSWSSDGRRNRNCFVVARQGASDMWLEPNWHAFEAYARSGRAASYDDAKTYPGRVDAFVSTARQLGFGESFRFVDAAGEEIVVPFRPLVINQRRRTETMHERQVRAQTAPRPLLAGPR